MYDERTSKEELRPWDSDASLPLARSPDGASTVRAWPSRRPAYWRTVARPVSWLAVTVVVGTLLLRATRNGPWRSSGAARPSELRSDGVYAYATPMLDGDLAYQEHPIHGLIRNAKREWADKVARQSKTYDEAVVEYRRRYKRSPPPGFDRWYNWAVENDVQLIDEFDVIMDQTEPFWALPPSVLQERIALYEDPEGFGHDHTIVTIRDGKFSKSGGDWRDPVPGGFVLLMEPVAKLLPNVQMPLYLHDASSVTLDWEAMNGYRQAAREGRYVNEDELPIAGETFWFNRDRQCAPDSAHRREISGLAIVPPMGGPPFIHDHFKAMSYCNDPHQLNIHGATSGWPFPQVLRPSFALSRAPWNGDMVWPSTIQYDLNPENESEFREKAHKLLWRGSLDGVGVGNGDRWRQSHRFRLATLFNSREAIPRVVRETRIDSSGREYQVDETHTLAQLNARYSNVRPTGGPVQCAPDVCEHLRQTVKFYGHATLEEMANNRYVMDVDGNAYSARFRAHLASNQVPFKSTIYPEWYEGRIQPWVHYVPVRLDYADLYNILAFFDGGIDAARTGNHDDLAEEIAYAGADWARHFWRDIDMQAYVFRLSLEWARILDPSREKA